MLFHSLFFLLTIDFTLAFLQNIRDCGKSLHCDYFFNSRRSARHASYPWMVLLQHVTDDMDYCGGTIINENWILTTASCIHVPNYEKTHVGYAGVTLRNKLDERYIQKLELSKVIIHPKYTAGSIKYDIAMIKTKHAIDIQGSGGHVNAICLPNQVNWLPSEYPTGNATVIGWNLTDGCLISGKQMTDALQEADVPITPPDTCRNISSFEDCKIADTLVCADGYSKNMCSGRSGDPLFQKDKRGVAYLIGVASTLRKQNITIRTVYINVAYFMNWMNQIVELNEK